MNKINGAEVNVSNISDIELNQLRLLQLIFETKNLTRAGERAGLTQSAVSHTLKKLRHSFNDSLVIRQGNKLILTPRAEYLQAQLSRWLNDFERHILTQEQFEPAQSSRTFYIATSDLVEQSLAPALIQHLSNVSPNIQVVFAKLDKRGFASQIESGEVDFSISVIESSHPALMVTTLYKDDYVSVVRQGHPYLNSENDLASYCRYPHILAGTGKDIRGTVDDALDQLGRTRKVQYKVANFSSAPYIVETSDAIFTAPRTFVEAIRAKFSIAVFEPPLSVAPFSMKMYWDIRNKDDQASRWFRQQITSVARQAAAKAM
ncbi:LysR family transcriptional regulator [Pseudoalteromonas sp. OOF1S-7]|uniref:LysR family transcriptional regulator n=1 Tax=Pseudoalteromonas sp. OOF1S-7 TaxID=2917757 RepID=UPI001EF3E5D7|nr:LysR family transcriptional regulator [Pseudoalteromonas sp. OOF1S-7]MCG7535982.1 LysR family transcriptional regulator [Pseudoalteromonas sp. OOF1S-7]